MSYTRKVLVTPAYARSYPARLCLISAPRSSLLLRVSSAPPRRVAYVYPAADGWTDC
ncbi:hypothetical protein GLOTRDRAFT_101612 [Gloeophyllum trabeum ATCC 11539]|uniref:Uncharacterized protein n=1 Tax=Gloeophyllum trabeum (strain ATCC 11539 / FP-39264 / Madison 617) TaxID=670483 RepID=S7PUX6_GLOTA|nr:uncharacterized protein GLOTRDRAFT_101612 [Gloeophyllum trabeum ATCC 11539]EPQ51117.1 hypothetical protein GLOTRDRAFT_101612 [Gloeophyllum trabeum ATCC 11539]